MRPAAIAEIDLNAKPIFVCWETTKACLLACRHCRARAIRKPLPGELDYGQGIALIDQLLDFDEPRPALLLTGGDPMMRPDLFDLLTYAKEHGIYTAVAASVTELLSLEAMEKMKQLDVGVVSVSLDGALPETHDRVRGIAGTWRATIRALEWAKKAGLRMQVNSTVMKSNVTELADLFHIAKQAGAVAWEVFFLIRTGRGSVLENLQPTQCEEVANFLYEASRYGLPVRTAEGPHFRRVYLQRQKQRAQPDGELYTRLAERLRLLEGEANQEPTVRLVGTGDGKGIMFVSHDGEVFPSGFLPISLGNVAHETLREIYTSNPLFLALRDPSRLKGRCGRCEYNKICGGSRSRAFAEYGDPLQEDPACPYLASQ